MPSYLRLAVLCEAPMQRSVYRDGILPQLNVQGVPFHVYIYIIHLKREQWPCVVCIHTIDEERAQYITYARTQRSSPAMQCIHTYIYVFIFQLIE